MNITQINKAASQIVDLSPNSGKESDDTLKFSQVLEKTKVDAKSDCAKLKTEHQMEHHKICKNETENDTKAEDKNDVKSKSDSKDTEDSKSTDVNKTSEKEQKDNQQTVNEDGSTVIAINVQQILSSSQPTASTPTTDTANSEGTISINTDMNVNLTTANSGLNINSISDINIKVVPNSTQQTQPVDQQQPTQQTQTIDQQSTGIQNTQQPVEQQQITTQPQTAEQQNPAQPQTAEQAAQTENNVSSNLASTVNDELNTVNNQNGPEIKTQSTKQSNGETVVTETQSSADSSKLESNIVSITKDDNSDFSGAKGEDKSKSDSGQSNGNLGVSDGSPLLQKTDNAGVEKTESSQPLSRMIFNQISDQVMSNLKTGNTNFEFELHPQQLGKISIKMSIQDNTLTVEISASSSKTQNILLANSDDIKSMLQTHLNHSNQGNDFTNLNQSNNYWHENKEHNSSDRHQAEHQQNNNEQDDEVKETSTADFLSIMQALNSNLIYKGGD